MKDIIKIIGEIDKQDIYNIVVPVVVIVIGWIPGGIKVFLDADKYWKCTKNMSAQNRYMKFFWVFYCTGLGILLVYFLLIIAIMSSLQKLFPATVLKNLYLFFSIICHILVIYMIWKSSENGKSLEYKKVFRYEALMTNYLKWIPITMSILTWIILWKWQLHIIGFLIVVSCIFTEILAFIVLDEKSTMEFKYATFVLNDDTVIDGADVSVSYQKGNWIVAKYKDEEKEVRFRRKDVKRIFYGNHKEREV